MRRSRRKRAPERQAVPKLDAAPSRHSDRRACTLLPVTSPPQPLSSRYTLRPDSSAPLTQAAFRCRASDGSEPFLPLDCGGANTMARPRVPVPAYLHAQRGVTGHNHAVHVQSRWVQAQSTYHALVRAWSTDAQLLVVQRTHKASLQTVNASCKSAQRLPHLAQMLFTKDGSWWTLTSMVPL